MINLTLTLLVFKQPFSINYTFEVTLKSAFHPQNYCQIEDLDNSTPLRGIVYYRLIISVLKHSKKVVLL